MAKKEPDLSFNWTTPKSVDEPLTEEIARDDKTPTISEQAKTSGWTCEYYHFGKLEDQKVDYFNPGLVERPDGLWLLSRASGLHPQGFMYGQNAIVAFKLDEAGKVPQHGKILRWPVDNPQQHFEDPRGIYHPGVNQTLIGCCTFLWHGPGDWSGPHQAFGAFDGDWDCKKMDYPKIGGNPGTMEKITDHSKYEKNWLWFLAENQLCLLYKANPWMIVTFGNRWSETKEVRGDGVTWAYGEIRGGTTPVKVGDYFFTFFHSSLAWRGRYRRYYAGALAFDAKLPFTPRFITPNPILVGSQNDVWGQHKPLVVFPCGAICRDYKWLVTMGVNDMRSAWLELPHKDLLNRMRPVKDVGEPIFSRDLGKQILPVPVLAESTMGVETTADENPEKVGASDGEARESTAHYKESKGYSPNSRGGQKSSRKKRKPFSPEALANLRAAAAKARAARAAQRLNGEPPRKRRRRRKFKRVTAEARMKALKEFEAKKSSSPSPLHTSPGSNADTSPV